MAPVKKNVVICYELKLNGYLFENNLLNVKIVQKFEKNNTTEILAPKKINTFFCLFILVTSVTHVESPHHITIYSFIAPVRNDTHRTSAPAAELPEVVLQQTYFRLPKTILFFPHIHTPRVSYDFGL